MKKLISSKPPTKPRTNPSGTLPAQRQILLYIEANDETWRAARLRLIDHYDLVRAASAERACELLVSRGGEFAAIVMDVELGSAELSAVELTALLRGRPSRDDLPGYARVVPRLDVPVIFLVQDREALAQSGVDDTVGTLVIEKPLDDGALSLAIAQAHLERTMSRGKER